MGIKNILRKAAELVVELPEEPASATANYGENSEVPMPTVSEVPEIKEIVEPKPAKTVEQIVRDAEGPNLDEVKVEKVEGITPAPGGKVNFAEVYRRANLPQASFTAEQALEVMSSLPTDLPLDVRRKTVATTLLAMGRAIGVNTESVVADASRKLAALSSYEDALEHQTDLFVMSGEEAIATLKTKIAEHEKSIAEAKAMLDSARGELTAESERLDDVLEFFTADIKPSSNAPS